MREEREREESKGKFANKGVKQKEGENKTKPRFLSKQALCFFFFSPHLSLSLLISSPPAVVLFSAKNIIYPIPQRKLSHWPLKD
jgi:hypothetical protein